MAAEGIQQKSVVAAPRFQVYPGQCRPKTISNSPSQKGEEGGLAQGRGPDGGNYKAGLLAETSLEGSSWTADFPCPHLRLGSALLAAAGAVLLNFARAKIAGDVNVRALLQVGRELGDLTEACDAMPFGLGLPLALTIFPRAFGGERKDG
jgi:hypothetical protein